jgi:hypothetical protein
LQQVLSASALEHPLGDGEMWNTTLHPHPIHKVWMGNIDTRALTPTLTFALLRSPKTLLCPSLQPHTFAHPSNPTPTLTSLVLCQVPYKRQTDGDIYCCDECMGTTTDMGHCDCGYDLCSECYNAN